jgi:glycosyltransferase involved in cell wall biosynthesis
VRWIGESGHGDRFSLLGRREDVPSVLNACDVVVSSSAYGEGFPNVIGEAMACGVPCVVTDVGDSRSIVGATGTVVAPEDAGALSAAVLELLAASPAARSDLGEGARLRIAAEFDIGVIAERYRALWEAVRR